MKKIFALILIIFVYSCGYTSIYQEMKKDLNINILDMKGDFELNNYIKNDLKISSNKDSSNIHNLNIETEYNKIILAKDATGKVTDYNIEMNVKFIVVSNNKSLLTRSYHAIFAFIVILYSFTISYLSSADSVFWSKS